MIYNLKFLPLALKEWKKLDNSIQQQLKKKLKERLINPRVSGSELRGYKNYYKIKLRSSGYRLVYEVLDKVIYILVIIIGKRNRSEVYKQSKKRKK
jgi:mRNA interferase RelE/StbE